MKLAEIGVKKEKSKNQNKLFIPKINIGYLNRKLTNKQRISFYNELTMLLNAGIELSRSLELIRKQEANKKLRTVFDQIGDSLKVGRSFAKSIENSGVFTKYEIFSIQAGEETRKLPECLKNLAGYYERKIAFNRQIISLISYPAFVIGITLAVLYFMLTYVVPMFGDIFRQFGSELPSMTLFVIRLANIFDTILVSLLIFLLAVFLAHKYLSRSDKYLLKTGLFVLKIPQLGFIKRNLALLKFSELMTLLLQARIPLLDAIEMALATTTFYPLQKNLEEIHFKIAKGYQLHEILDDRIFDRKIITLISIGEEVNELDKVFNKISEFLSDELDHRIKIIGKVMEPLLLVLISSLVGFILIAMYYPMFTLSKVINN